MLWFRAGIRGKQDSLTAVWQAEIQQVKRFLIWKYNHVNIHRIHLLAACQPCGAFHRQFLERLLKNMCVEIVEEAQELPATHFSACQQACGTF